MKKEFDIHNFPQRIKKVVEKVNNSHISQNNKDLILKFRDQISLDGLSPGRIERYIYTLKEWATLLEKDFDKATKDDMIRVVRAVQENNDYAAWTKSTYKIMLKRFFKWLKQNDYPEETKWITTNIKATERKIVDNNELITEEEVLKLIRAAEHPRDKAFISILYESGTRIGEIASLQLKNIKFDENGVILNVTGKTGPRPIRIISSVSYLTIWTQSHPLKDNPDAPLWINIGTTNHNKLMQYGNIRQILGSLFKKAGINKRFNPHLFRHSRATFMADYLTEFQMNQYFGWTQGSRMPSTYIHMNGKKIDASILAMNGLKKEELQKEKMIKPIICPRCDTINSVDSKYCNKCAGILDAKTAIELQEKSKKETEMRNTTDDLMRKLMQDKDFFNLFLEKMNKLNGLNPA